MKRVQRMWSATGRFTSRALWTAMAVGLVVISVTAVRAQSARTLSPAELFKEAQRLQQGAGNLEAAIETYRRVLGAKPDRALAARAQLAMADCFATLGKPEAAAAYEAVVRDYKDQAAVVKQARAWLDARTAHIDSKADLQVQRLWAGGLAEARPLPDGRRVAFVDWSSGIGSLALRDVQTGEKRVLVDGGPTYDDCVKNPLPSPDGRQIAYRFPCGKENSTLRIINADGTRPRVLLTDLSEHFLEAWSPDGKLIAGVRQGDDRTNTIVLISAVDGSVKQLKSTGQTYPAIGGFSRDGRLLLYGLSKGPEDPTGGVFLLATDGARETVLVPAPRGGASFGSTVFTLDGRRVLFVSNRSGSPGLWSINVTDGRAEEGSLVQLQTNVGSMYITGLLGDGSLYYLTRDVVVEAYTASFDAVAFAAGTPVPVSDQGVGNNRDPVYSPDGRYVAFARRRVGAPWTVVLRSLGTAEERPIGELSGPAYGGRTLQWFPDGRSILVMEAVERRKRFRQIDVESGHTRTLFEGPWEVWIAALSADGKALFYSIKDQPENLLRLMKLEFETRAETELYRVTSGGTGLFDLAASPDGRLLAFNRNIGNDERGLFVVSTTGGTPLEVYRSTFGQNTSRGIAWLKDSQHLLINAGDGPHQLHVLSLKGGPLRPVGVRMQEIERPEISRDGRRITFWARTDRQELWVARNLLSDTRRTR